MPVFPKLCFSGVEGRKKLFGIIFVLGSAPVPSRNLNGQVGAQGGSMLVPLKETSVESLLKTSTQALAELQVPREQLSEVLEQICNGSCGPIYRTKRCTGDPAKSKMIVLKALKGKWRSVRLPFPFLVSHCEPPDSKC